MIEGMTTEETWFVEWVVIMYLVRLFARLLTRENVVAGEKEIQKSHLINLIVARYFYSGKENISWSFAAIITSRKSFNRCRLHECSQIFEEASLYSFPGPSVLYFSLNLYALYTFRAFYPLKLFKRLVHFSTRFRRSTEIWTMLLNIQRIWQ